MEKSGSGQLSEANGVEDMAVLKPSLKVESSPKTSCGKVKILNFLVTTSNKWVVEGHVL